MQFGADSKLMNLARVNLLNNLTTNSFLHNSEFLEPWEQLVECHFANACIFGYVGEAVIEMPAVCQKEIKHPDCRGIAHQLHQYALCFFCLLFVHMSSNPSLDARTAIKELFVQKRPVWAYLYA